MNHVTLGSINLDRGEGLDYLQQSIVRMSKMKPTEYFMDIICQPDQLTEALNIAKEFYSLTNELIPSLKPDKKFISITCNPEIRPCTMALVMLHKGDSLAVVDLNPERKGRA